MNVIIVAAGQGNRLKPLTNDIPKPLLQIEEKRIIEFNLTNLSALGIEKINIVTGHQSEQFHRLIGNNYKSCRINYIHNSNYRNTDNMFSLWLAMTEIDGEFIFINGDVIVHKNVFERILSSDYDDICLIDDHTKLVPDAMKVKIQKDKVVSFGRDLSGADARAIGLYKFSNSGFLKYFKQIEYFINKGVINKKIEPALERFIKGHDLNVLRVESLPWIEIDDLADLEKAKKIVKSM